MLCRSGRSPLTTKQSPVKFPSEVTFGVTTFDPKRVAINPKKIPSFLQYLSEKFNYPLRLSTSKWRWKKFWYRGMRLIVERAWESENGLILIARRLKTKKRYLIFLCSHKLQFNEEETVKSYYHELYLPIRPFSLFFTFLSFRYHKYPNLAICPSPSEGKVHLWVSWLSWKICPPLILMRHNKFNWKAIAEIDDYINLAKAASFYDEVGGDL